jgi:photosystem II stability/assembly factor-like uncharacterized protein
MANRALGILMAVFVAVIAAYAFYPRSLPEFPATATQADRLRINGLAMAGERIVAVGESGHILISDDRAASWRDAKVTGNAEVARVEQTLTQVAFVDDRIALAVGHDGLILRSEDRGESWVPVRFEKEYSDPLFSICAGQNGQVFVSGSFGRLLVSRDAGKSFEAVPIDLPDGPHLNAVSCSSQDGRMMAAGEMAQARRSQDGGLTWTPMQIAYNGSLYGVVRLSDARWVIYGMLGHVFRTEDFGATWGEVATGTEASFFGHVLLADGKLVLLGQGGTVLVSADGGASFRIERSGGREALVAGVELAPGRLVTGGEKGISEITLGRPVAALAGGQ